MDFFRQLINGIAQAWNQLSLSARVNLLLAGLAVIAVIAFVAFVAARPQYVSLATAIEPGKVSQMVGVLDQNNVPFELGGNGDTIRVPLRHLSTARLRLAENDLAVEPGASPGFELFQDSELFTSRWLQDVKFMRAIQGELERQLNALDFVDYSLVLIREAEQKLFATAQQPSEAAVTLKLNRPPTKKNVKGIVNLVAAAGGPNLHPGNITVYSTQGDVLHTPPASDFAAMANSQLEHIAEIERRAEQRIMDSLNDLGVQGTVRVSASVNFEEKEIQEEKITEGTELSTMVTETTTTSAEDVPEGAPGAVANVPEGTAPPGSVTTSEEMEEELINYEPSRTMTTTKMPAGEVEKYNVALIVEGDREATTNEEGETVEQYVGLTEEREQFYMNLIKGAVGDGTIPTEATVNDHPFDIGRLAVAEAEDQFTTQVTWQRAQQLIWNLTQILLIILGFFLIRMLLRRAIEGPEEGAEIEEVSEMPEASREDLRRQEVFQNVSQLASREPESAAALLRSWLGEEES